MMQHSYPSKAGNQASDANTALPVNMLSESNTASAEKSASAATNNNILETENSKYKNRI
jgi:hypothetical protein